MNIFCVLGTLFTKHTVINLKIVTLKISALEVSMEKLLSHIFQKKKKKKRDQGSSISMFREVTIFSNRFLIVELT